MPRDCAKNRKAKREQLVACGEAPTVNGQVYCHTISGFGVTLVLVADRQQWSAGLVVDRARSYAAARCCFEPTRNSPSRRRRLRDRASDTRRKAAVWMLQWCHCAAKLADKKNAKHIEKAIAYKLCRSCNSWDGDGDRCNPMESASMHLEKRVSWRYRYQPPRWPRASSPGDGISGFVNP